MNTNDAYMAGLARELGEARILKNEAHYNRSVAVKGCYAAGCEDVADEDWACPLINNWKPHNPCEYYNSDIKPIHDEFLKCSRRAALALRRITNAMKIKES